MMLRKQRLTVVMGMLESSGNGAKNKYVTIVD